MATRIHVPGSPTVPKLPVFVHEHDLEAGALQLLKHVRPEWKAADVNMKLFTDGITNKLVGCSRGDSREDVVLIRVYGNMTELFVDRDNELKSFQVLQAYGCAPSLYCTFLNGLCYEFMHGHVLDTALVRQPDIFRLTARELARIHAIHAHNGCIPKPNLWMKLQKYFSLAADGFPDPKVHARFLSEVPSRAELEREMLGLQETLAGLGSPVVLCHNDLLVKNIIYNADKGTVRFIDYEYASYNYQAYDIGNHFNEFAGVSDVDYSLYPDKELQFRWLRAYLEAYKEFTKNPGRSVADADVQRLYVHVSKFSLVSHYFWGLWSLIQAKYSTIDFDFLGYAIVRFTQYRETKPHVMALEAPL
uniref:ethanolamine kinase n=1 Tax=Petromyzon marinus TaxID=7757 RepID=A0AAJ7UD32_PETMA|nr:ethanolamine kinase 1-like [Petromyzon marinus]